MDTCVNGHERTPANTRYITNQTTGKVTRKCKLCDDLAKLRYEENRKARREECTVDGCPTLADFRSLCERHRKLSLAGVELKRLQKHTPPIDRIKSMVNVDENDCWIWAGKLRKDGYANFTYDGVKKLAHRATFESFHEITLTRKDVLDHLCMVKACCNPAHLDRVTQRENIKRSQAFYSIQEKYNNLVSHLRALGYSEKDIERISGGEQELKTEMVVS